MKQSSPTVYLSRAAWERLDAAQTVVDQHASDVNGFCRICRVPDPCPPRAAAAARISGYGLLPRRRSGRDVPAGRAESARACATRDFTWFNQGLVGVP